MDKKARGKHMIIAVVGARIGRNKAEVFAALDDVAKAGDVIISGAAEGVDTFAAEFARSRKLELIEYPPDQNIYPGQNPYFARNKEIAMHADLILAFPTDSGGTWNTIMHARKLGKRLIIFRHDEGKK
jgi:predicted Rossmann fold nucleotide-binding protein DprA/Smf involved in DNA uptake